MRSSGAKTPRFFTRMQVAERYPALYDLRSCQMWIMRIAGIT
jgi:hypothetical protein